VKRWVVEHNHVTREITGVVCHRCNIGLLAYSDHNPDIAQRLADYLKDYPARQLIGGAYVPEGIAKKEPGIHSAWQHRKRKTRKKVPLIDPPARKVLK